jgi:hypothetical protein
VFPRGFDHGLWTPRARRKRPVTLAGLAVVLLSAALPVALSVEGRASAGARVVASRPALVLDALHTRDLLAVRAADLSGDAARLAVDGRDDTVWTGSVGEMQWRWAAAFARPVHLGLLRARFGASSTSGVPTELRWEVRPPQGDGTTCGPDPAAGDDRWTTLEETEQSPGLSGEPRAQPTRRSWFVDADACALRLVVDRTNAGPPMLREVQAFESARDVLRDGVASDEGAYPGMRAADAIDGTYARRWAGAPGKARWTLRVDLRDPQPIDRIRLVLGFDATSVPRPGTGRSYAVAWAPTRYSLEASDDGKHFTPLATEPTRADGTILPLRRRLVRLPEPRTVRALRLVITGATGASGLPEPGGVPVVREMAAYAADDKRPILAPTWILSVNANPSAESHRTPGGEVTNDAYHAKFLQSSFVEVLPAMRQDDRFARSLGDHGEPLDAPPNEQAGEVLESIEGDDPLLDGQLLSQSSPPPIAVLSGSNDWDYASGTGADPAHPKRWYWNPLRDARFGGMGRLAPAVRGRVAPFLGFCGGAQILALLEAKRSDAASPDEDQRTIDRVLRRTSGRPIRGFAPPIDVERSWPTDSRPQRAKIEFLPDDTLFADLSGPARRSMTQALPELHADAVRPDAFLPGGPLQRFEVLARSAFCAPDVVAASPQDGVFANPSGSGWCDTVPEAFRSKDGVWPIIGAQFHAEQRDFASAAPGDPPESTADPQLFLAAAYEQMVDAYVTHAP